MNSMFLGRADAVDTLTMAPSEICLSLPSEPFDALDALDEMARADHADWLLLRLVLCAAGATLVLALASSLRL